MARVSQICAIVLLVVMTLNAIVPAHCASIMLNVRINANLIFSLNKLGKFLSNKKKFQWIFEIQNYTEVKLTYKFLNLIDRSFLLRILICSDF